MDVWIEFPLLADGIGTLISVVFLVIAFLSWIINLINGQNQAPKARGPQNRPQRAGGGQDRLQNEIEVFLQEVQGRKRPQDKPRAAAPPVPEQVRERPPRRARPKRPAPQARRTQPAARRQAKPETRQPDRKSVQEKVAKELEPLAAGLDERHLKSQIDGSVAEHLKHLESNLTPSLEVLPEVVAEQASAGRIGELLRDPTGVRQAILLNEILSRPVGLRSKS